MSTRKLALLAAVVAIALAVGVVVGVTLARGHRDADPTPSTPSPTAVTETYNPDANDADEGGPPEAEEAIWGAAVDNFAKNFTNTSGGETTWRQRLIGDAKNPYVTPKVAEELSTVDIRKVPKGHYESREILESSAFTLAIGVRYKEGWGMVLWLNTDGTTWQIYAYDKWDQ